VGTTVASFTGFSSLRTSILRKDHSFSLRLAARCAAYGTMALQAETSPLSNPSSKMLHPAVDIASATSKMTTVATPEADDAI